MSNISNSDKPNVLILGSGTPDGGGSGPRMLIDNIKNRVLNATIAGLVTHYPNGGVAELGKENEKLFDTYVIEGFPSRKKGDKFSPEQILIIKEIYKNAIDRFGGIDKIDHIILSGWMKLVLGLATEKTENIHPSRIDRGFGGEGKYGDLAHQHAFAAYQRGEISETALTMHFVDGEFDHGPVIAQKIISLEGCKTWEEAKSRVVGSTEHKFQLAITKALLEGDVKLKDGIVEWKESKSFDDPSIVKGSNKWD